MTPYLLRRLFNRKQLRKVFVERATEPIHLNLLSIVVAALGSYRAKVDFDLVVRQQYAFPILYAADMAIKYGLKSITLIEFGVANGAGLLNMCRIAERTRRATGIEFHVFGFDTGKGMPPAIDYRDLPEVFQEGDFPMDFEKLRRSLPDFAHLVIGDIEETIPSFLASVTSEAPIGFVAIDTDYYSSAIKALRVLNGEADLYLPVLPIYLDDIGVDGSNPWTGELLAINEFNRESKLRKISPFTLLRSRRIFKNTQWIDRMYAAHIHDHPLRSPAIRRAKQYVLANEYLETWSVARRNRGA
ncbi:MAG TPA: hypothetical protein VH558_11785 [Pseudolabrys sp.]|jgi:hypothetical protein